LVIGREELFAAAVPSVNVAPPADACSFLTQAYESGVLGIPVGAGEHLFPNGSSSCWWAKKVLAARELWSSMSQKCLYRASRKRPLAVLANTLYPLPRPVLASA
jgi:hypothetical protein